MLPKQCAMVGMEVPEIFLWWANIKVIFEQHPAGGKRGELPYMLERLGLKFEGRLHSGIDDCHNLARIALTLARDYGCLWATSGPRF